MTKRELNGDFFEEDESPDAINDAFVVGEKFLTSPTILTFTCDTSNTNWTTRAPSPFEVRFASQLFGIVKNDQPNESALKVITVG